MRWLFITLLGCVYPLTGNAGSMDHVDNPARARINYMLNCQGCHGPSGAGTADGTVPGLDGFMARFLSVPGGREFLVQVPGSANAALDDAALAEVLNWMLATFDPAHLPDDFAGYAGQEVGALRASPLTDVVPVRARLVGTMAAPDKPDR